MLQFGLDLKRFWTGSKRIGSIRKCKGIINEFLKNHRSIKTWQTCRCVYQNQQKIQDDFCSERLGEQSLCEDFGKIFKPVTEQQQKTSEEIVSKLEAIEN